jgi:hypothetical protein
MKQRTNVKRMAAFVAGLALAVAACGSDGDVPVADGSGPVDSTGASSTTSTIAPSEGGRGWIDGEPLWRATDADGELSYADGESADIAASSGAVESRDASSESELREAPIPVEPDGGIGDGAGPPPFEESPPEPYDEPIEQPVDDTPLRAGSVDDNTDYQGFLVYLERIAGLGIATRDLDASDRSIITVRTVDGRPAAGAPIVVRADGGSAELRTTADGTVRFHPGFHGMADATTFEVVSTGDPDLDFAGVTFERGADTVVEIPASNAVVSDPVPLDVLFLLDATGSMGDEIDRLKATIDTVAQRVGALDPAPDVRFAMTLYRDEGDAFVTANYDFTGDIAEFQSALADVVADGGGDYPEALDEGLADALAKPSWRDPSDSVQLIFVVADAPPQVDRQVPVPYTDSVRTAVERGIKIFPIASSESDDQAEAVFRQLAQATGAPFVFLSNGAAGAATGGSTDIQSTDYEELALDELVVRLIAEELSDLRSGGDGGGGQVTVPTTVPPVTTNPDGQ